MNRSWHTNWNTAGCPRRVSNRFPRSIAAGVTRLVHHGVHIEVGFRPDLIVEDPVIVEIKSVEVVAPVHKKQSLTQAAASRQRLGLLVNFNVALIRDGITRVVNGLPE
ncbi:MAG TPA: GxxExxY protein [Candidatus Acidoferrales bacterium]|jgi:GxxExxY protein|nr:GxxExxY protein [Candidatus Acidoferrales bacterium]